MAPTPEAGRSRGSVQASGATKPAAHSKDGPICMVVNPKDHCGATVGKHGKKCVFHPDECPHKNHQGEELDTGLYLTAGGKGQVWGKHHASLEGISAETKFRIDDLMDADITREDGMAIIQAVNDVHSAKTSKGKSTAKAQLITQLKAFEERFGLTTAPGVDRGSVEPTFLSPMPDKVKSRKVVKLEGDTTTQLGAMKSEFDSEISDISKHVHELSMGMKLVQAAFGTPSKERGQKPAWSTLEDLDVTMDELTKKLEAQAPLVRANTTRSEQNLREVTRHTDRLNKLQHDVDLNIADLAWLMKGDQSWIGNLQVHLRDAAKKVAEIEQTAKSANAKATGSDLKVTQLSTRVNVLERPGGNGVLGSVTGQGGVDPGLEQRVTTLENRPETDTSGLERELRECKTKVAALESKPTPTTTDKAIDIDGGRWSFPHGSQEVDEFVHNNGIPKGTQDLSFVEAIMIPDPIALVDEAHRHGSTTREAFQAEEVYATRVKTAIKNSHLAAAFQNKVPACLTTAGSTDLSKIKTFKDFDAGNGVDGVANKVKNALREIRRADKIKIEDDLRDLPALRELALYMLNSTIDFLEELFNWAGAYYRTLVSTSGASTVPETNACWKLTSSMLSTMFDVIYEPRRPAHHAHTFPPRKKLVTYLVATLRTQMVMEELKRANFAEHPRIFPKLMKFIFESHTPRIEFVALKEQLQSVADSVVTLKRGHDNILARLKALERHCKIGGGGGGGGAGGGVKDKKDKGDGS